MYNVVVLAGGNIAAHRMNRIMFVKNTTRESLIPEQRKIQ